MTSHPKMWGLAGPLLVVVAISTACTAPSYSSGRTSCGEFAAISKTRQMELVEKMVKDQQSPTSVSQTTAAVMQYCGTHTSTQAIGNIYRDLGTAGAVGPSMSSLPPTSTAQPSPTSSSPSVTPSPQAFMPQIVLTPEKVDNICADETSGLLNYGGNLKGLEPHGIAIIECSVSGQSSGTLLGYDLLASAVTWKDQLPAGVTVVLSGDYAYWLQLEDVPAIGLADGYVRYSLSEILLNTGAQVWDVPLESWLAKSSRTASASDFTAQEGVSSPAGGVDDVLVSLNGTTAFATNSGKELWHSDDPPTFDASHVYLNDGAVEVNSDDFGSSTTSVQAFDVHTGKLYWRVSIPTWFSDNYDDAHVVYYNGTTEIRSKSNGFIEFNYITGRVVREVQYPESWKNTVATDRFIITHASDALSLYQIDNLKKATWSDTAAPDVSVVAIGNKYLLVDAPAGYSVIRVGDGTTVTLDNLANPDTFGSSGLNVVDGLVQGQDGTVLLLEPPTPK